MTLDYAITMRDRCGRTTTLSINGASIDDLVRDGYSRAEAVEGIESNAFQNAVARGEIGADAETVNYRGADILFNDGLKLDKS